MLNFYLFVILFLLNGCFDIWVRRFILLPVAISSGIALLLIIFNQPVIVVWSAFAILTIGMYIVRYYIKKK
ncbi:MAG: hypothetical protein ACRCV7_03375 [Culicoidibacterales bacterium]